MRKIAIIGLGLMGGSLGMAVKSRGLAGEVCGFARRAETGRAAMEAGAVDSLARTPGEAVRDADISVFCVPVMATVPLLMECRECFADGSIVTDVGSSKAWLCREARPVFEGVPCGFAGSHPIAGSDETGIGAARQGLYDGAVTVVTTSEWTDSSVVERVAGFWRSIGCRVFVMPDIEHDMILARTSHLPHMAAAALARAVLRDGVNDSSFCGSGFRDTTRIACGSGDLWHDIVFTNSEALKSELDRFAGEIDCLRGMLERSDFEGVREFLEDARRMRGALGRRRGEGLC